MSKVLKNGIKSGWVFGAHLSYCLWLKANSRLEYVRDRLWSCLKCKLFTWMFVPAVKNLLDIVARILACQFLGYHITLKACKVHYHHLFLGCISLSALYYTFYTTSTSWNIRDCAAPWTTDHYNPSLNTYTHSLLFSLGANSVTMLWLSCLPIPL